MAFRIIKNSLINNVLGPAELGRFRTIGYQRQGKSAEEVKDSGRTVQAFYSGGEFSRGAGVRGPKQHDITFRIELTAGAAAKADMALINSPTATPVQIALAMADFQEASALADESFDELADIVFQILMDARNIDLGLPKGIVSNRWVGRITKDDALPRGENVILTGSMVLTCRAAEVVAGATGAIGTTYDVTVDIQGDNIERAGVAGTLGGE